MNDGLVARAESNFRYVWSSFALGHAGGEVRERDGLLIVNAGCDVAMFNQAIVMRALPDPEGQLAAASVYFDNAGLPFVVRVPEGLDAAAEQACEKLGMPYSDSVPGMVLSNMEAPASALLFLEVRAASSAQEFDDFVRITSAVFDLPMELCAKIFSRRVFSGLDVECYIGYVDHEAVATAALFVSHRTAGISNIATVAGHRGKGIGAAMTWRCVQRGAELGCVIAALQASDIGQPVYTRMGFEMIPPWRTFHR